MVLSCFLSMWLILSPAFFFSLWHVIRCAYAVFALAPLLAWGRLLLVGFALWVRFFVCGRWGLCVLCFWLQWCRVHLRRVLPHPARGGGGGRRRGHAFSTRLSVSPVVGE